MDQHDLATRLADRHSLKIQQLPIASLTPRRNNPRTHSEKQIRQIAESIKVFGFTSPILIDAAGTIIAGHGRLRAAKLLGMKSVPTVQLPHLSDAQVRALVIADNKLAELAGWDQDLLKFEIQHLAEIDLDFDLTVIGLETAEIDLLVGDAAEVSESDPADASTGFDPNAPIVTRRGDHWKIGRHSILCADALENESYARVLGGRMANLVFVDPPYNVRVRDVAGLGKTRHAEFAMASGEMSDAQFIAFLEKALSHHAHHSADGALHFVCMDWRHSGELLAASRDFYSEYKNLCIWVKSNGGMGSLYRSQHELIHLFKVGTAPHANNVELGRHGRNRTNVWRYAGVNTFGSDRNEALATHPTVKPVRLVADAILDCSRRGDLVLDGFAGSGTTLLAAERTGRIGYALEIEPRYVDATIRRMAEHAGLEAILAETGQSFHEVAKQRMDEWQGDSPPTNVLHHEEV